MATSKTKKPVPVCGGHLEPHTTTITLVMKTCMKPDCMDIILGRLGYTTMTSEQKAEYDKKYPIDIRLDGIESGQLR